jgi:hypothetical protein
MSFASTIQIGSNIGKMMSFHQVYMFSSVTSVFISRTNYICIRHGTTDLASCHLNRLSFKMRKAVINFFTQEQKNSKEICICSSMIQNVTQYGAYRC